MEERFLIGHRQQICLFDCIYSFSHKPTFNLQIFFRQPEESLQLKSRLIFPVANDFKTWKENKRKKSENETLAVHNFHY